MCAAEGKVVGGVVVLLRELEMELELGEWC